MTYENLIQIDKVEVASVKTRVHAAQKRAVQRQSKYKTDKRGCEHCPLNKVKGINKIFGKVRGKRIMLWAQSPGRKENDQGKELLGSAGQLLWREMVAAGVTRDMCDIQNVVRCFPADWIDDEYLKMRNPTKEEIHCCSIYNEKVVAKLHKKERTRVHVVFGQVAAQALLGKEYRKNQKIFYSDRFKAWIVLLDHPAFFIRRGEGGTEVDTRSTRFKEWREGMRQVARLAKVSGGRFAYLEKQDYQAVVTAEDARRAKKEIVRYCHKYNERLSVDFEEGLTKNGKPTKDGTGARTKLVIGFSPKPGVSRVFWLDHPDLPKPRTKKDARVVRKIAQWLLECDIPKVFQKGNYDVPAVAEMMDSRVANYDFDTEFGAYFDNPDAKAYGLAAIASRQFPQLAGYKEIILPESLRSDFTARLPKKTQESIANGTANWSDIFARVRREHGANLALLPWKKMLLYNGGDCDLQKRAEVATRSNVHMPLMHVYRDAGFVLARMERFDRPKFDYKHHKRLSKFYPVRRRLLLKKLRRHVKKITRTVKPAKVVMTKKSQGVWHTLNKKSWKSFNPNSPPQVLDLLYNWLKLPIIETKDNKDRKTGKPKANSTKETLVVLAEYHPVAGLIKDFRHDQKVCSTYLEGFYKCAEANDGTLKTKWWLTGAGTGRISSGGGGNKKQADDDVADVVNLQNVHGDPQLQCLLISDRDWWKLQKYWNEQGEFKSDEDIPDWVWNLDVFLGFDHAQMELRVLAQKSGDKALIKIFSTKPWLVETKPGHYKCRSCGKDKDNCGCGDPHSMVGHELTGWPIEQIKNDERIRRTVKNMQFGIVFGLNEDNLFDYMVAKGVYKYSDGTSKGDKEEKKNREEVRRFHRKYFKRFAGVKRMIERDRAFAENNGYMVTLTGLKRKLNIGNNEGGSFWGNQAVNGPIQGTASHLMLMGLVPLQRKPKQYKLLQHPQLEIHDALYLVVKLKHLWKAAKKGIRMLEKEPISILRKEFGIDWKVPLMAEPKAGFRFGLLVKDIHKIKGQNKTAQFLNAWCAKNKLTMGSLKCQMTNTHKPVNVKKNGKRITQCKRCGKQLENVA